MSQIMYIGIGMWTMSLNLVWIYVSILVKCWIILMCMNFLCF